jgi:hypothetical protein
LANWQSVFAKPLLTFWLFFGILVAMGRPEKQELAIYWLRNYLSGGSRPDSEVKAAAREHGLSIRTLNRAKQRAGVESVRRGAGFHWRDPDIFEEQVGSPNLVNAITELTRAIHQLVKASKTSRVAEEEGPTALRIPGSINVSAVNPRISGKVDIPATAADDDDKTELIENNASTEVAWSDEEYEEATYTDIVKHLNEMVDDLADYEKLHGTAAPASRFGRKAKYNNVPIMGWLREQITRANKFAEIKRPPPTNSSF